MLGDEKRRLKNVLALMLLTRADGRIRRARVHVLGVPAGAGRVKLRREACVGNVRERREVHAKNRKRGVYELLGRNGLCGG